MMTDVAPDVVGVEVVVIADIVDIVARVAVANTKIYSCRC